MTLKRQRLLFLLMSLSLLAGATALILSTFQKNIVYFYTPSDIAAQKPPTGAAIRLGGMVKSGSTRQEDDSRITFTVTDGEKDTLVHYQGMLPNLFREGQGVITEGRLTQDGSLDATTILAKHDENYMPPEVAKRLKGMGHWKTDYGKKP